MACCCEKTSVLPSRLQPMLARKLNIASWTYPAAFPYEKLAWLNGVTIRNLEDDDLYGRLLPFVAKSTRLSETKMAERPELRPAVPLIKERIKTLAEAGPMLTFFFEDGLLSYPNPAELIGEKMTAAQTVAALEASMVALGALQKFEHDPIESTLRKLAEELGLKVRQLFQVIRVAVTGTKVSPPLFETIAILGRNRTVERLGAARDVVLTNQ